jgi:hypothetical protein
MCRRFKPSLNGVTWGGNKKFTCAKYPPVRFQIEGNYPDIIRVPKTGRDERKKKKRREK